ncbi:MAG: CRISPR-associated protein, Cas5h family [uncultured Sulfurovum sp.]|uniref:CRISPR-associated protein, Cas5h family n=1 Tax=uncultured Sulfurovum sp. TaxID=269237 RepID=A0A6S6ST94_9BACT|nr:MAG: CRISPR-associated protein, Cas5h family [uncultured Sulfurovum sp.]
MSIVAFTLTGDYAHFSHPATIYSSLTYPIPPKTAIMGFLGAVIGEEEHYKLGDIKYSIKIDKAIVKKSFVFNGIKSALSSNMHIKEGYQNSSFKKQFYRELICSPSYTVFVDLSLLNQEYQEKIIKYLKEHKTAFTPYLGINFCLADFEWIEIEKLEKIKEDFTQVHSFTRKDDFEFESDNFGVKLTTANMACDVEKGRVFKDFQEFIIEIGGENSIKSKNRDNIYQINENRVYFV